MARNLGTGLRFHPTGLTADDIDVTVADVGDTHLLHIFVKTDGADLYLALNPTDATLVGRAIADGLLEVAKRRSRRDANGECVCNGGDLPAFDHSEFCPRSEEVLA